MIRINPERPIHSKAQTATRTATVALGGGGARGLAHLGVMQAIGEAGIQAEQIVGVSMGSLIGAMCAAEPDIHLVQTKAIEFLCSPPFLEQIELLNHAKPVERENDAGGMFSWYRKLQQSLAAGRRFSRAIGHAALASDRPLRYAIDYLVPDCDISDLPTPLSIVAVDLLSGNRVVLEQGPLRRAVQASSAIPGIFRPVKWDGMLLCDIGTIESVPTRIAKSYDSELLIAVDVGPGKTQVPSCDTVLEVMMRMDEVGERLMRKVSTKDADIVVRPEVGNVEWFDFSQPQKLIDAGLQAGRRALRQFYQRKATGIQV